MWTSGVHGARQLPCSASCCPPDAAGRHLVEAARRSRPEMLGGTDPTGPERRLISGILAESDLLRSPRAHGGCLVRNLSFRDTENPHILRLLHLRDLFFLVKEIRGMKVSRLGWGGYREPQGWAGSPGHWPHGLGQTVGLPGTRSADTRPFQHNTPGVSPPLAPC